MKNKRILVVEDERIVAWDIQNRLKSLGYEVVGATGSGDEAVKLAQQLRPDLVLMDIHLDDQMDGITAAVAIRNARSVPVVFLTAYSDESTLERAKEAAPFGYILKPFEDRELRTTIEMAFSKHEADREIRRLNRLYAVLSQVNQSVVRASTEEMLFQQTCSIAIEYGEFKLAWIGAHNPQTKAIEPVAWLGENEAYVRQVVATSADQPNGQGPAGTVIRENRSVVCNDILQDPAMQPWRAAAQEHGLQSVGTFPIRKRGEIWGVFAVYATEPNYFQEREVALLEEVAVDLSFALDMIEKEAQRQRANRDLRDSEERFRALIENASDVITILEADGTIRYESPSVTTVFGYEVTERIGQNAFALVHPEDLPKLQQIFAEGIQAPGRVVTHEYRYRHKDGSWRIVQGVGANLLGNEAICGVVVHSRDITERRRAEAQLRLQSSALESAANGIVITDQQGTIVWANLAFTKLTGYGVGEVQGRNPRVLKSGQHDDAFYKNLWETVTAGKVWRGEMVNKRKDGQLYTERMSITPVRDEQGTVAHFIAIKEDITLQKLQEQELLDTNAQLEQALVDLKTAQEQSIQQGRLNALGTLASGIAHDFNNSLAAILGFSDLLVQRPEILEDKAKTLSFLEMINTAAKDARHVVSRLREFYRHRDKDEPIVPVDLNQVVEQSMTLTQPRWESHAQARGATIRLQPELQNVPVFLGNAADLREALTNLILNAVDAMPNGGVITLRTRFQDQNVMLEITDTGLGMTPEVRERCLDPFFTTKGEHGTGLGLAMVYGIIQRHKGKIEIDSIIGKGTTFTLFFPLARNGEETAREIPAAPVVRPQRVLLVDDQIRVCLVITEMLTGDGHTVEVARNGREALDKFAAGGIDLAIVDRAMPGMSGDELTVALKQLDPTVPIIMLTGFGRMMIAADEKPTGVDLLVSKPVSLFEMREALSKVLTRPPAAMLNG